METKHSTLGIISFCGALTGIIIVLGAFVAAALHQRGYPPGQYPGREIVGLFVILGMLLEVLAGVIGTIAMFEKEVKKLFGIIGLAVSGVTLFGTVVLMIIGIAAMMARR